MILRMRLMSISMVFKRYIKTRGVTATPLGAETSFHKGQFRRYGGVE